MRYAGPTGLRGQTYAGKLRLRQEGIFVAEGDYRQRRGDIRAADSISPVANVDHVNVDHMVWGSRKCIGIHGSCPQRRFVTQKRTPMITEL